MPHIIGTAGHIDHGKTALVRALTGQETDRLAEERARGISIDLGFAYLDLANGERVGIVDVPGHERFIRNTLAGAHGIDLVLLVVAADDGVMPQTEEHLDIVHLLGACHGIVALTKTDLVDAMRIAAVQEEIEMLLAGTRLEGAPIVPVSALAGSGLETLRQAIEEELNGYQRTPRPGPFRLPVDRAFVMRGHGVVVTGTAISGDVHPGDAVRVLPGGETARVRTVQVHGVEVAAASYGQRVALNLAGIERSTLERGHVVCDPLLERTTDRCDAWVEIRPAAGRAVKSHELVRVYIGTAERLGKLVLLDGREALHPRQYAHAQLVLRQPVHTLRGDRFVMRDGSARRTIGGGLILHPFAPRHHRSQSGLIDRLDAVRDAASAADVVRALLDLEGRFAMAPEELAETGALPLAAVRAAAAGAPGLRALPDGEHCAACTTASKWEQLRDAVVAALEAHHRREPLAPGMEMESLRSQVAATLSPKLFRAVLDALVAAGVVARDDSTLRLPTHHVRLRREEEEIAGKATALIVAGGFMPPDLAQIEAALGVSRQRLHSVLQQLEREGRVARISTDLYFGRAPLDRAWALLRDHVRAHGEIGAATFRDLLGASRKFSIALLDYFDRNGLTLRVGDLRKLRGPKS
jgi:selenocysteine-specific elongation factor